MTAEAFHSYVSSLTALSQRLAISPSDNTIALRVIADAIQCFTTAKNVAATRVELDLIAWTMRAQGQLSDAELLERAAQAMGNISANTVAAIIPFGRRRR
jgi:hypothetical protein